jgi:tetratricopeptide (TPR) repeat protein
MDKQMISSKKIKFKLTLIIALTLLTIKGFSQNDDDKILIQNFYKSCKSESYGAFNAVNKGIQLFDTKQYSRSMISFENALEKDDKYCDAWYLIGYCYQKTGELEKAIEACDKALIIEPKNASAIIVKANTMFMKGDTLTAIDLFTQAKGLIPDKIDAYYGLALMLHYKGDNVKALQFLNEMETNGAKTPNVRDNKKIKNLKNEIGYK